ncbi:hypothetical protein NJ7G_3956 [Natrinema sp. J7-2]|nr:hypothetical protein NJ7G_3956 [Natrinema sp. J7-2]
MPNSANPGRRDRRECELCGQRVPAATYREHLLKECPGE